MQDVQLNSAADWHSCKYKFVAYSAAFLLYSENGTDQLLVQQQQQTTAIITLHVTQAVKTERLRHCKCTLEMWFVSGTLL